MLFPEFLQRFYAPLVKIVGCIAGLHARRITVVGTLTPGRDDLILAISFRSRPGHRIIFRIAALCHKIFVCLISSVPELYGRAIFNGCPVRSVVGFSHFICVDCVQLRILLGCCRKLNGS